MNPPDIFPNFTHNRKLEHVYIIGSSPTVQDDIGTIPDNAACIYLNKAILLKPNNRGGIWLCADSTLPDNLWFTDINNKPSFTSFGRSVKIFSNQIIEKGIGADYSFRQNKSLGSLGDYSLLYGVLKANGTVAAQALQLATWCKAETITLAGITMTGNKYFDDSTSDKHKPGSQWGQLSNIQQLIYHIIDKYDISIVSLTETALDIPYIRY